MVERIASDFDSREKGSAGWGEIVLFDLYV